MIYYIYNINKINIKNKIVIVLITVDIIKKKFFIKKLIVKLKKHDINQIFNFKNYI